MVCRGSLARGTCRPRAGINASRASATATLVSGWTEAPHSRRPRPAGKTVSSGFGGLRLGAIAVVEVNSHAADNPSDRGGKALAGSGKEDSEADDDEMPRHRVRLTNGFWLGDTPVTEALYFAVMGMNPSGFVGHPDEAAEGVSRPVETVNWHMAWKVLANLDARIA